MFVEFQILHSREETRRQRQAGNANVTILSTCPGLVSTNIVPPNIIARLLFSVGYSSHEGILGTMCALLHPEFEAKGGEIDDDSKQRQHFVTNYLPLWRIWPQSMKLLSSASTPSSPAASKLMRNLMSMVIRLFLVGTQSVTYGCYIQGSSPESENDQLAGQLYDWTEQILATKGYLP